MMEAQGRTFGGALLIVAGLNQLTPFKRNCLKACRSPAAFIARHWKRGVADGLRLGITHALFCLGCCWALMLLLIAAGLYQLTPFKRTRLESCRSPTAFIAQHWKRGVAGGFRLGLAHGLHCLGCCWALMLLLFVGGVMNLWWIGALPAFVLLEKLAPLGAQGGRLSGLLILAMGLWKLAQSHG